MPQLSPAAASFAGSVNSKPKLNDVLSTLPQPGSHTAAFINQLNGRPVHPAYSGKTMEFDGGGKCVAGCS